MSSDSAKPSDAILSYKDVTPEEREAERLKEEADALARADLALAAEVARLTKLAAAFEKIPPELILADAVSKHAAETGRIATAIERFNENFERGVDIYRDLSEWERRGSK